MTSSQRLSALTARLHRCFPLGEAPPLSSWVLLYFPTLPHCFSEPHPENLVLSPTCMPKLWSRSAGYSAATAFSMRRHLLSSSEHVVSYSTLNCEGLLSLHWGSLCTLSLAIVVVKPSLTTDTALCSVCHPPPHKQMSSTLTTCNPSHL